MYRSAADFVQEIISSVRFASFFFPRALCSSLKCSFCMLGQVAQELDVGYSSEICFTGTMTLTSLFTDILPQLVPIELTA